MAERVGEVMNREVLAFEPQGPAVAALDLLLEMGVTSAPVIDGNEHPVGVISLRELAQASGDERVAQRMCSPALIVGPDATLTEAAGLLDDADLHHLVVVDPRGRVVGFVSSMDLLRGFIGAPARHPVAFPHCDDAVGAVFSDDRPLDPEHTGQVPHEPGLIVLVRGGAGRPERVTWAESTLDLKDWLIRYFAAPTSPDLGNAPLEEGAALRFRYAIINDPQAREEVAFRVRERAQHVLNVELQR